MKTFKDFIHSLTLLEGISIPSNISYGTNAPEFSNENISIDNKQDALMAFYGIHRDFHYTMFKYEDAYVLVGMGNRDGSNKHRLVMAISDTPHMDWKKYSFTKQFNRSGFLWLTQTPRVTIKNMQGLYGAIGFVAAKMVGHINPAKIVFNGYTPRMTDVYKGIFKTREISSMLSKLGYSVRTSDTWIILDRQEDYDV